MGAERVSATAYAHDAVPVSGAYGVPAGPSVGPVGAVPYASYEDKRVCTALKKNGEACAARPLGDAPYCIGHKRYMEALNSLGEE